MDSIGTNFLDVNDDMKRSTMSGSMSLLRSGADYLSSSWKETLTGGWRRPSEVDLREEDLLEARRSSQSSTSLCFPSIGSSVPKFSFLSESLGWSRENGVHNSADMMGTSLNQPAFLPSTINRPAFLPSANNSTTQQQIKMDINKSDLKNECKQVFFDCAL